MKKDEEIFCVRFNKAILKDGDIYFTTYTLNVPCMTSRGYVLPTKITLRGGRITVEFNDGTKHIFYYNSDVEIFIRKKEENGGNIQTDIDKSTT